MDAFWKSCFDFRWYGERRDAPSSQVALVFLMLTLLLSAARVAVLGPETDRLLARGREIFLREVPPFRILRGEVLTEAPQPWSREFEGGIGVVMDTTGQVTGLEKYVMGALLTRRQLLLKHGAGGLQVLDLDKVEAFDSRGPAVEAWLAKVRGMLYPFLTALMLGLSALGLAVRWTLTGLLAFLLAQGLGAGLGWKEALRMAAFALVPTAYVILLGTVTPLRVTFLPTLVGLFFLSVSVWSARGPGPGGMEAGRSGPPQGPAGG